MTAVTAGAAVGRGVGGTVGRAVGVGRAEGRAGGGAGGAGAHETITTNNIRATERIEVCMGNELFTVKGEGMME